MKSDYEDFTRYPAAQLVLCEAKPMTETIARTGYPVKSELEDLIWEDLK